MDPARTLIGGLLVCLAAACLAEPPGHLPSSVRVLYSRATDDSLGERTDIYFLVARSGNELQLTGDEAVELQPTFAPDLRRVFYTRENSGRHEIWSMSLDGSEETLILSAPGESFRDPAVSPDEKLIAYTRVAGGRSSVEIAAIDGSNPRPVVEDGTWSQPAWSPNGRSLVVAGEQSGAPHLYVVPASGGSPRSLTSDQSPQGDPDWSPDGARVAFKSGVGNQSEIAVAEVNSGAITRLTENDVEDGTPAWSPTGERIVFVSRRPDAQYNLWLMDADGSDVESLTEQENANAADPDWL